MLPTDLELPFLERRPYLHGTTLFDAMMRHVPEGAAITFKIPKRIDSDRVRLQAGAAAEASASLSWTRGAESGALVAIERARSAQPRREGYDEAYVERRAVVQGKSAVLRDAPPYGLVQTLIPLFKALLRKEVTTSKSGQWMFTRLDLERLPTSFIPLTLQLSGVAPNVLARARVLHGTDTVGEIYFSWVAKES